MGKKVNPICFRLGINKTWSLNWFKPKKDYASSLREDLLIVDFIKKNLKQGAIKDVKIARFGNQIEIKILAGRPGVIIGRGGSEIEKIKDKVLGIIFSLKKKNKQKSKNSKVEINISVEEVRNFEENASLVAQSVGEQLEKRVSFRRVLKSALESVMKQRSVKGARIMVSGRLDGNEMCRTEWVMKGGIPLHTLRADIDFAKYPAHTSHGLVGVKVWIYKGEVLK